MTVDGQMQSLATDFFWEYRRMEDMDRAGRAPIDRGAWSLSSRRSLGHYDEDATEYEGIRCQCYHCRISFVCSAEEQRDAYEAKKKHVSWLPKFCPACEAKLAELRERDDVMQIRWNQDRKSASQDAAFVREWQEVIGALSAFGKDKSMGVHLKRLSTDVMSEPEDPATNLP